MSCPDSGPGGERSKSDVISSCNAYFVFQILDLKPALTILSHPSPKQILQGILSSFFPFSVESGSTIYQTAEKDCFQTTLMKNHGAQYNYPTSPTWSSPHLTCISLQLLSVSLVAFVFDAKARLTLNKQDGSGLAIAQWLTIHDWNISVNDQWWVYTGIIYG